MNVILGDMITVGLLLVVIEKLGEGLVILVSVIFFLTRKIGMKDFGKRDGRTLKIK